MVFSLQGRIEIMNYILKVPQHSDPNKKCTIKMFSIYFEELVILSTTLIIKKYNICLMNDLFNVE